MNYDDASSSAEMRVSPLACLERGEACLRGCNEFVKFIAEGHYGLAAFLYSCSVGIQSGENIVVNCL